jgi:hypothetical protein
MIVIVSVPQISALLCGATIMATMTHGKFHDMCDHRTLVFTVRRTKIKTTIRIHVDVYTVTSTCIRPRARACCCWWRRGPGARAVAVCGGVESGQRARRDGRDSLDRVIFEYKITNYHAATPGSSVPALSSRPRRGPAHARRCCTPVLTCSVHGPRLHAHAGCAPAPRPPCVAAHTQHIQYPA